MRAFIRWNSLNGVPRGSKNGSGAIIRMCIGGRSRPSIRAAFAPGQLTETGCPAHDGEAGSRYYWPPPAGPTHRPTGDGSACPRLPDCSRFDMKTLHIAGAAVALAALSAVPPATAQQTRWYLAEGSTGPFFEEEVLAINPTDQTATGIVRVYRDGTAVDIPIVIPPRRRTTLPVNQVPGLATGE